MPEKKSYYCERCKSIKDGANFYTSNNLEKYPNEGKLTLCKQCVTAHVDNFDPDTYLWILQELDVPYVPDEWNRVLLNCGDKGQKITGTTILGKYLSRMKLKQYKKYRWSDTEYLQKVAQEKIESAMRSQGYGAAEIHAHIQKTSFNIPSGELKEPAVSPSEELESEPVEDYFAKGTPEITIDLTDEDATYLCLKWGKAYKPEEWVKLEQLYEDMMASYDIQTAGHLDTLKLICKTSLKANQLIDIGDVEGFQKMQKAYDSLMKSGKFTAAQNKSESGEYIDSISELVAICETDGFIPRYYTDGPQDKVDRTLQDLQSYTRTLVTEEMNLGNLIEQAVKQIEIDREKEAEYAVDADNDDEAMENSLFTDSEVFLQDQDYEEFKELEEEMEKIDEDFFNSLIEEE